MVQQLVEAKAQPPGATTAGVKPVAETGTAAPSMQPASGTDADSVHLVNTVLVQPEPEIEAGVSTRLHRRSAQEGRPAHGGMERRAFLHQERGRTVHHQPLRLRGHRLPRLQGRRRSVRHIRHAARSFRIPGQLRLPLRLCDLLTDANSTTGAIVRDVYLNVRIRPEFQFQAGQFKEPFAQETGIGATNLDFVERGLQSLLYPCAGTAYRCPGMTLHGDISGGVCTVVGRSVQRPQRRCRERSPTSPSL